MQKCAVHLIHAALLWCWPRQQHPQLQGPPPPRATYLEEGNLQVVVGLPLLKVLLDLSAGPVAGRLPTQPASQTLFQTLGSLQHPVKEARFPGLGKQPASKACFPLAFPLALPLNVPQLRVAVQGALQEFGSLGPVLG